MDEYPEYDFYNSRETCNGKRRGEERKRRMGKPDEKKGKKGGMAHKKRGEWRKVPQQDRCKEKKKVKMES